MAHPGLEELVAKFQAARHSGDIARPSEEQIQLHRELFEACPAFTQNTLFLAWLMQRRLWTAEDDGKAPEGPFKEIQHLLEQAVLGSYRSASALVELGFFLDTYRDSPHEAAKLYEEGATKASETLKDAWWGLLRYWNAERTKETLEKALKLGELAERMFPDSPEIIEEVMTTRQYAAREGLLEPKQP
ncbi:hypothetical protein [Vitiosangium sp. GDMCC 1.1324]|uniref:hypothetical protein n=1 Tax=Vitiosangium sp. (strain GDMCC 1.1324) TaxID=2138576 RepID=UPI000D343803|nr:hypothetical protein [Vitiosangium sp. GDMCC 1.1324]PTL82550.1 hypothetical protein DAT35_17260 [Vitiosangium sp. GDMCC 1.1324]